MIIKVLVELSIYQIDKTFSYIVPNSLQSKIKIGIRVLVPFSYQKLEGFVLEINDNKDINLDLKEIIDVIDEEVILTGELLELGKYVSKITLSTLISAYQAMLPRALKAKNGYNLGIKKDCYITLNDCNYSNLTMKQQEIIALVEKKHQVLYCDLKRINLSVDTLLKKGVIKKTYLEKYRFFYEDDVKEIPNKLTDNQNKIYFSIKENLGTDIVYLLYGVTGSGKTEIYMKLIDDVIKSGKEALLLVPEITLTNQILIRFRKRFNNIAVLHSSLTDGERYDEYRRIKKGEVDIVIGTRSAIFAPLDNIGIIIIDECHSATYKQDNMPCYDSIAIAEYRGKTHHCPVLLGSATPSLVSFAKAQKGICHLLTLTERVGKRTMPEVILVNMLKEKRVKNTFISEKLSMEINRVLDSNEQIILLLNRRGYASISICKNCGYTMKCPNCDISLIYHKSNDMLRCHYCGYAAKPIKTCPNCHEDTISYIGSGTEKIEEELIKLFPKGNILRMDLDTTSKKGSHEKMINDFGNGKYNILLGTQMIAKGLDFPNVTLVGVINADSNLSIPSYRSSEETFQLLNQVSGRSGRSEKKGKVIIQTYNVDHYAIRYASMNDYLSFYKEEMKIRFINKYPPYYYLGCIKVKAKDYHDVYSEANKIQLILKRELLNAIILEPMACIPFKINNTCRVNILIKYKKEENLYIILKRIIDHYASNNKIKIDIDFNPNNI